MNRRLQTGFTLLEVMVALAIVALALATVTASMSQMIDAAQTMRDRTYANWIAQNKITELRLLPTLPNVGSSNGEVEFANVEWAWRATISETGVDGLYRTDVAVSFPGDENSIRTVTGFLGPSGAAGEANNIWGRANTAPQGPTG